MAGDGEGLCRQLGRPEGWNLNASPPRPLPRVSLSLLSSVALPTGDQSLCQAGGLSTPRTDRTQHTASPQEISGAPITERELSPGFPSPFLPPHTSNKQARVWASARPRPARWGQGGRKRTKASGGSANKQRSCGCARGRPCAPPAEPRGSLAAVARLPTGPPGLGPLRPGQSRGLRVRKGATGRR